MKKIKLAILKIPILGHAIYIPRRMKTALKYFYKPSLNLVKWLFKSNETTNFTYDLEEDNKRYLALLIAEILNMQFETVLAYIKEIEEDGDLKHHIKEMTLNSNFAFMADKEVLFGRRIGWYAFARALKPKIIMETGVDKGIGSCLLTAALKRNEEDGHKGKYYGTDINPNAGYLLSGNYADYGKIIYGDSIESLTEFDEPIDLFINDSDHSADYEAKEYDIIANKLSKKAIVLGDNSHCTDKLLNFSLKTNRNFIFFQEKPFNHWYPGAGIGICFNSKSKTT